MEGVLIRYGSYIMSFYRIIKKNYAIGKCLLKEKVVCYRK